MKQKINRRYSGKILGVILAMAVQGVTLAQLHELTATETIKALHDGQFTAVELVENTLARIDKYEHLNAFISIDREGSLVAAHAVDEARESGLPLGPLAGVPLVIKDNINTANLPTTAGTPALENFQASTHAPVVQRLVDAGAIIIAKTNMHELAMGITSDNAHFGRVANAYNPDRFSGGSSGGTGTAIGARLVLGGLGSDTGGSVRIPSALNGIAGLRPTIGSYPSAGIVPISSTRDTAGPMARTVGDLILLDNVITGYDQSIKGYELASVRLGLPSELFWSDLEIETRLMTESLLEKLRAAGAEITIVPIEGLVKIAANATESVAYEAKRELARYLQKFNTSVSLADLADQIASPDVRSFLGVRLSGEDPVYAEAYREMMEVQRPALQGAYRAAFVNYELDALIFPTTPLPARSFSETRELMLNGRAVPTFPTYVRNTAPATIAGLPGLTIPIGLTSEGLPVGIALDGPPFSDRKLLAIGLSIETLVTRIPPPD